MEMRELTVLAGSFVGFQLLFTAVSPRLSSSITPGYTQLPSTKVTEWNSRFVSTVHALIVGLLCLYILWFDDAVNTNPICYLGDQTGEEISVGHVTRVVADRRCLPVDGGRLPLTIEHTFDSCELCWGDPSLVKLNVAITCGYLLYDLVLLACNWGTMGDSFFVCHHLAAIYAYTYVLTRGVLPYFANFRLISELSTPFVNQRWFFEALKYPRSHQLVVLNGIAMTAVFFMVRIAVMPSYWARVFASFGTRDFELLGLGAQVAWIMSCVVLDILNIAWMYKIARGCYKVLSGTLGQKYQSIEPQASSFRNHSKKHTD
ncbi:TLC domain-containing protein 4-B isoform X1 [Takifugu rubripes]|nr:transmembrane protein 56-B-like isoform X1 [Takifugu rubripes]